MTKQTMSLDKTTGQVTRQMSLCVVIPTYNEEENIAKVISRLDSIRNTIDFQLSIVVVDDNSCDLTRESVTKIAESINSVYLLERPSLLGIGSAYLDGFAFALFQNKPDYYGEIDADLQHPPEVLVDMCRLAERGIDVIVASRYLKGGGSVGWPLRRRIVSKAANFVSRICVKAPIADSTSGFRMISSRAVKGLLSAHLSTKGYAFQIESLYMYRKLGMSFAEVPYVFQERKSGKTKLKWKEMGRFAVVAFRLAIFGKKVNRSTS